MNPETQQTQFDTKNLHPVVQARLQAIKISLATIEQVVSINHINPEESSPFRLDSNVVSINSSPLHHETVLNVEANRDASIARQYAAKQYADNEFSLPAHLRNRAA